MYMYFVQASSIRGIFPENREGHLMDFRQKLVKSYQEFYTTL